MSKSIYSKITSWTIRILLLIIVLGGVGLLMLTTLEGKTDHHRKGLEQAFSDMLKADLTIGQLDQFTILPQLKVKAGDLHGVFRDSKNEFMADSVLVSFGFFDLMRSSRKIQDFELKNFRFASSANQDLRIDFAGIDKKDTPAFIANGSLKKKNFDIAVPMTLENSQPPAYHFSDQSVFNGTYGSLVFKGIIAPAPEKNADIIKDGELTNGQNKIALIHAVKQDTGGVKIKIDCLKAAKISDTVKDDLTALGKNNFVELSADCPK